MSVDPPMVEAFSNRALFQRSRDPIFLLNRQRRLRFANAAWERLTGQSLESSYGMNCSRRSHDPLAKALSPPPEATAGGLARSRRPAPPARVGPPWWDIVFLPLAGADGLLGIIGRITVVGQKPAVKVRSLPEGVLQLRHRLSERFRFDNWDSEVGAVERLCDQARLASQNAAPVVLIGEAGAGKRWLARAIHHQGIHAGKGFVAIDCRGLTAQAITSLLFEDSGPAIVAASGTLFLREPQCLARDQQARLFDWLSQRPDSGPRIVASFRNDPAMEVAAGRLVSNLLLALSIQTLAVPPLRERADDLPRLASGMLERAQAAGLPASPGIQPETLAIMRDYSWPGNLRELDGALAHAARQANGLPIAADHLPQTVRRDVSRQAALMRSPAVAAPLATPLDPLLERVERQLIQAALRNANGIKAQAARALEIPYNRLIRRMRELKIAGAGEP